MFITIVEPNFEILTSSEGIVEHTELCGRTCYKSFDKITSNSAEAFVRRLIKSGHESVLEHASMGVKIICDRACAQQLTRHRIGAYCLSGDTVIKSFRSGRGACSKYTLKQLYNRFTFPKQKGTLTCINLRSVNENGVLIPNKIKSITHSGKQEIYKVKTLFGREIKATIRHRFLTPTGYKPLLQIQVGDNVIANGHLACFNPEWLTDQYLVQNKTLKEVAKLAGVSRGTIVNTLRKYGLKKTGLEANSTLSKDILKRLVANRSGENGHNWRGTNVSTLAGNARCQTMYGLPTTCETCDGSESRLERHHKDEDTLNNEFENIMFLCRKCHYQWHHGQGVMSVFTDTIVSIEPDGITDTYDIGMEAPYHNFVANGFLVHNSMESQRYCNLSQKGFQFIAPKSLEIPVGEYHIARSTGLLYPDSNYLTPCSLNDLQAIWIRTRLNNCKEYEYWLKNGMRPEDARSVLPNATKTEVVTTYNIRQWRHVFRERALNPHAQWQIKDIMLGILEEFNHSMPSLFGDLK